MLPISAKAGAGTLRQTLGGPRLHLERLGYNSKALQAALDQQGLLLITTFKKNLKNRLLGIWNQLLLRKRALIEAINDQLKNLYQIEPRWHLSPPNFLVNRIAALIAYTCEAAVIESSCQRAGQTVVSRSVAMSNSQEY